MGVSERERSGWKFESPPGLLHPGDTASMLEGAWSANSSGRGGAPGSPGLGRFEEAVEEATLTPSAQTPEALVPCKDAAVSKAELEALCSPSGWKRRVESWENMVDRWLVVGGELAALLDGELEAAAVSRQRQTPKTLIISHFITSIYLHEIFSSPLRVSIFSFFAFCTSSVILVMMKFCERISLMESVKASKPRGFSASMSSIMAVLLVCVVLQLISSASSRVRILRERRKSRCRSALILSQR